jgi:histidine triad (HIT) family protein
MINNNCIFCKLANGEIPSYTLYEDDLFRVIMDLSPASKGHCLLLPKEHFDNLLELDNPYLEKALFVAKKVSQILMDELKSDGINILQNNGETAGQTVHHFHIHIIPRYNDDLVGLNFKSGKIDEIFASEFSKKVIKRF